MAYTREELDWIEAEWAFHLHGRSAFLSAEDFRQVTAWEAAGLGAETVVAAMDAYFARREKKPRARAFVSMAHLEKDVAKAAKLRASLARAEAEQPAAPEGPLDPRLQQDPRAKALFEAWRRRVRSAPAPDRADFLDHLDAERAARRAFVEQAANLLGPQAEAARADLAVRLREAGIPADTPVWRRAFEHHWGKMVLEAFGIGDG
jgi:hypothetical protein